MQQNIANNWHTNTQLKGITIGASVTISKEGKLLSRRITESCGKRRLDDEVLSAIDVTEFEPLPLWFSGEQLEFSFVFMTSDANPNLPKASNSDATTNNEGVPSAVGSVLVDNSLSAKQHALGKTDAWSNAVFEVLPGNLLPKGGVLPTTEPMTDKEISSLKQESFDSIQEMKSLPQGVREGLKWLTRQPFLDFADPGQPRQIGCLVENPPLPPRGLKIAFVSKRSCLISYDFCPGPCQCIPLILFTRDGTNVHCRYGTSMTLDIKSVDDAINAIKVGVRETADSAW